jgi:hypothetical protein
MPLMSRFPRDLPAFLAVLAGLWISALTCVVVWAPFGRSSSTSGLAYLTLSVTVPVFAAGGYYLGVLLRRLLWPDWATRESRRRPLLAGLGLLGAIASAAALGIADVREREEAARPRILDTTSAVDRIVRTDAGLGTTRAGQLLWEWPDRSHALGLGGKPVALDVQPSSVTLHTPSARSVPLDTSDLGYVDGAYGVVLHSGTGREWLVVVISGRATGRRAIVAVLSDSLQLLHLELLERCWRLDEIPVVASVPAAGDDELAVLPRTCSGAIAFRLLG